MRECIRNTEQVGEHYLSYDYDADFYAEVTESSILSANAAVPILAELFQPKSVLDVGCGAGAWVKAWQDAGVEHAYGMDGAWAKDHLLIAERDFIECDLANDKYLNIMYPYELVQCLEVAEHLPESRAEWLVRELCVISDLVVFGAAIPGQGGHGHINEQPHEYWIGLFNKYKYVADTSLQPVLKFVKDIAWWYSQNIIVFRREK